MSVSVAEANGAESRTIPGLTPARKRRVRQLFRLLTAIHPALAARVAARAFTTPRARPLEAEELRFLASANAFRIAGAHGITQVYEWPGHGPAILVVHGWVSHAARLRSLIEALTRRGLRVVAFDAPAHGRSSGRRADLHSFSAALAAVSAACAPVGGIIAHSFGALTAASWLAEEPSARSVRAAVLVGLPRDVGYLFESFTLALALQPRVIARVRALFLARYGRAPEDYSAVRLAQQIRLPVLLVHGGADEFVPPDHSEDVALALLDGRVHRVPGFNHSAPLRDPATIDLIVDFIAARTGAAPAP